MQGKINKYLEQNREVEERPADIPGSWASDTGGPTNQRKRTGCFLDALGKLARYTEKNTTGSLPDTAHRGRPGVDWRPSWERLNNEAPRRKSRPSQPQDGEGFLQQNFKGANEANTHYVGVKIKFLCRRNLTGQLNVRRDLPYLDSAGTDIQNLHVEYLTVCVCVCVFPCVQATLANQREQKTVAFATEEWSKDTGGWLTGT